MEDALAELIRIIYRWIKRKCRFYLYNKRGKKNASFVDYGIALCYENEWEGPYYRNKNGQGEVFVDASSLYSVYSNVKGTYSIKRIKALCIEPQHIDFAKSICERDNGDYSLNAWYDNNGDIQIDICCEIKADPKEKKARLYINGYIQYNLDDMRQQIQSEYLNYKKNNLSKTEYNI